MTTPAPQVPVPPSAPLFAPAMPPVPPTIVRTARALPVDAVIGGLAFHRLIFARRRSGWWTQLVTGILVLAIYLGLLVVVMVVIGIALFRDPERLDDLARLGQSGGVDMGDPLMVAILLGTIALMLPAYILASLIVNGPRVGLVSSAAGRLRWRWMLRCGALAVGVSVVLTAVGFLLPGDPCRAGRLRSGRDGVASVCHGRRRGGEHLRADGPRSPGRPGRSSRAARPGCGHPSCAGR